METFFVKPAQVRNRPGVMGLVRDPVSGIYLKEEGEEKPRNTYWLRRVRFKDVVEASIVKKAAKFQAPVKKGSDR